MTLIPDNFQLHPAQKRILESTERVVLVSKARYYGKTLWSRGCTCGHSWQEHFSGVCQCHIRQS